MSFSLGFEDLPNSSYQTGGGGDGYQPDQVSFSGASGGGQTPGHAGYGGGSAGDEAFSTAFSPHGVASSPQQDLKVMLESSKDGLKVCFESSQTANDLLTLKPPTAGSHAKGRVADGQREE